MTVPTMLSGVPCLILLFRLKDYYNASMILIGIVVSMIYHSMDGFNIESFLYIKFESWHKFDNMAGALGISSLCYQLLPIGITPKDELYRSGNSTTRIFINMVNLWIILIAQE